MLSVAIEYTVEAKSASTDNRTNIEFFVTKQQYCSLGKLSSQMVDR